jgi:DNA (cytosine-5)-methyltransferase 1
MKELAYAVKKIGSSRGAPRVWIEGWQANSAGFSPRSRYNVIKTAHSVVLSLSKEGERTVSFKQKNGQDLPVIDLNSKAVLDIFEDCECVRVMFYENEIVLLPVASDEAKMESKNRIAAKIANGEPLSSGSVCHGGGILTHAVHAGLSKAGLSVKTSFVIEMREDLVAQSQRVNSAIDRDTMIFEAPLQEIAYDFHQNIPKVDILEMGLPCSGASLAGRAKHGTDMAEAHPLVGWLVAPALTILARANPYIVLIENVPTYANSASAEILRGQLRHMGYSVHESVLDGADFGSLEHRKRWCVVAVRDGLEFSFDNLPRPSAPASLGELLDDIPANDPRWREMSGLKAKQERDRAAGKGFMMQIVDAKSTKCPTITKGYQKNRSTDPKVRHPADKNLLRLFTPAEHARIKRIPEALVAGIDSLTQAHEILGQSIVYSVFESVAQGVGESILKFDKTISKKTVRNDKCSG